MVDRLNPLLWLLSGLVLGVLICILLRPTPIASQNHYEHHGTAVHHHHGAVHHHVHHNYDSEMPELDGNDEPGELEFSDAEEEPQGENSDECEGRPYT